jgi:hypothetical protein
VRVSAVCALDLRTGRLLHRWQAHDFPVVNLFPVNSNVVSVAGDHSALLWSTKTWSQPASASTVEGPASDAPPAGASTPTGVRRSARPPLLSRDSLRLTPSLDSIGDSDSVSVAGSVALQRSRRSSAVTLSQPLTLLSPSKPDPTMDRRSSVSRIASAVADTPRKRVDHLGRWEGVLGGGNSVTMWHPTGVLGPAMLISTEGCSVGVNTIMVRPLLAVICYSSHALVVYLSFHRVELALCFCDPPQ